MALIVDIEDRKFNQDFVAAYSFADKEKGFDLLIQVAAFPHTPSITLETIVALLVDRYTREVWTSPNGPAGRLMVSKPFYKVARAIEKHPNATPAALSELVEVLKGANFLAQNEESETIRQELISSLTGAEERLEAAQQQSAKSSRVLSF